MKVTLNYEFDLDKDEDSFKYDQHLLYLRDFSKLEGVLTSFEEYLFNELNHPSVPLKKNEIQILKRIEKQFLETKKDHGVNE